MKRFQVIENDRSYKKLLSRMFIIENVGEIFYRALSSKTKDNNLISLYEKLALNEYKTAKRIEKELTAIDKTRPKSFSESIQTIAKTICNALTARQLAWILKNTLKRKIYSKWYNIYKDSNKDFWQSLLDHENLQKEALNENEKFF